VAILRQLVPCLLSPPLPAISNAANTFAPCLTAHAVEIQGRRHALLSPAHVPLPVVRPWHAPAPIVVGQVLLGLGVARFPVVQPGFPGVALDVLAIVSAAGRLDRVDGLGLCCGVGASARGSANMVIYMHVLEMCQRILTD